MNQKIQNPGLAEIALGIAAIGAGEYLRAHRLQARPEALAYCLKSWVQIKLPQALWDVKAAMDCHMDAIAEKTFQASLLQAGIEAAKECGFPAAPPL